MRTRAMFRGTWWEISLKSRIFEGDTTRDGVGDGRFQFSVPMGLFCNSLHPVFPIGVFAPILVSLDINAKHTKQGVVLV